MKTIGIPLQAARLRIQSGLRAVETDTHVVFGGLIEESDGELRRIYDEFWEPGRCNGVLVHKDGFAQHPLAVDVGRNKQWHPDMDALENIDCNALGELGVGEIRWFGALGSVVTPLHAGYRRKGGEWVTGPGNWEWRQAIDGLMAEAGIKPGDAKFLEARVRAAKQYAERVMAEAKKIKGGDVYGVVVYAVPHGASSRAEEFDHEVWGHVGREWAEQALEDAISEVASQVQVDHPAARPLGG